MEYTFFALDAIWSKQTIPHSTRWSLVVVPPIYRNIGYIGLFRSFWPSKVSGNDKNIAKKQFFRRKLGKLKDFRKKKKSFHQHHETNLCSKFQKVWFTKSGRKMVWPNKWSDSKVYLLYTVVALEYITNPGVLCQKIFVVVQIFIKSLDETSNIEKKNYSRRLLWKIIFNGKVTNENF